MRAGAGKPFRVTNDLEPGAMSKAHVVEQVARATGIPKKDVSLMYDAFGTAIRNASVASTVRVPGLGSFKRQLSKPRAGETPDGTPWSRGERWALRFKESDRAD